MSRRQLLISSDAVTTKKQHTSPCSDCPWARTALPGWLAGETVGWWLMVAHGDGRMECHTRKRAGGGAAHQCAGAAIFRANVVKSVDGDRLRLPADKVKAFAWDDEFASHHEGRPVSREEAGEMKMTARFAAIDRATKTPKPGYSLCEACGAEYKIGVPHEMFCEARTCDNCGTSSPSVIEPDRNGRRICADCTDED